MTVLRQSLAGDAPPRHASAAARLRPDGTGPPVRLVPSRRPGRPRMRHVWPLLGVIVSLWVVAIFAHALSESDAIERRAAEVRAGNAALAARLEAGRAEVELIQTDGFVRLQARAYGLGDRGERAFALRPGTPAASPIVPLGADPRPDRARSPLDDWLDVLFGEVPGSP